MKSIDRHKEKLLRTRKATISFNELEYKALEKYFRKYNVSNRTKFMRETIMRAVLAKFSDDYPTLWDKNSL